MRSILFLPVCVACTGNIGEGSVAPGGAAVPVTPEGKVTGGAAPGAPVAPVGLRRLTITEYENSVHDLLGDSSGRGAMLLPKEVHKPETPFDDYHAQQEQISDVLVRSVELLAQEIAGDLVKDPARRDRVIGCKPSEARCLEGFVKRFGRRALRRPLTDEEASIYLGLRLPAAGQNPDDFYASVEMIIRAFLQDFEFLHRAEIGRPVPGNPGLAKLDDWEMASRLSYLLRGSTPTDALLDRAARGGLSSPDDVRAAAAEILAADPRARERAALFHGLWLGYENPTTPQSMKDETRALLDRVLFEQRRPWQDLFRAGETFVTYDLAKFYGLRIPGGTPGAEQLKMKPAWIPYEGAAGLPRRGLFSQGSFLSIAGTQDEVLMTIRRGKGIKERLFCQPVAPPPPAAANAMMSTASCKWEFMAAHRSAGAACAGCHQVLDVPGFGLDNYDPYGKYRASFEFTNMKTRQTSKCSVRAEGMLDGKPFTGPAALAELVLGDGARLNRCLVTQLHRFAFADNHSDGREAQEFIDAMATRAASADLRFDELLLDFVASPAFAHRRQDTTGI